MFDSSVSVRVQLSGAASLSPGDVGSWSVVAVAALGLRELCRQEQLYEQGKQFNTES